MREGWVPRGRLSPCQGPSGSHTSPPPLGSIISAPCAHPPKREHGEQVGWVGEAPCLSLGRPLAHGAAGGRSAPEPAGKRAPGQGTLLTGPCSWEISCETHFKPPNHKNGRFSQPCSHVSQISLGVFTVSIRETPGQPPAPGGDEETGRERLGCCGSPSRLPHRAPFRPVCLEACGPG